MHFVEGEVGRSATTAASTTSRAAIHSLSECLVCFTLRQLLVLLPVGCRKLVAAGLLVMAGLLARKGLLRLKRPHQERGWKREDGTSSPTHYYRRPGALCEADQYLDGSRSFHPCDHGKRNLAQASVTTTRISLSSRQPRVQCKAATISKSQPQQPF